MRIIAGKNRGTKLKTLEGDNTRPTLDRVKENIFNILQNDINDKIFLDLFGGSGGIGLEAISRKAKFAYIVDNNIDAINIIKENTNKINANDKVKIIFGDAYNILDEIKAHINMYFKNEYAGIIYIDPPYKMEIKDVNKLLIKLKEKNIINKDSIIIYETENMFKEEDFLDFTIIKFKKYGRPHLIFLCERGMNGNI